MACFLKHPWGPLGGLVKHPVPKNNICGHQGPVNIVNRSRRVALSSAAQQAQQKQNPTTASQRTNTKSGSTMANQLFFLLNSLPHVFSLDFVHHDPRCIVPMHHLAFYLFFCFVDPFIFIFSFCSFSFCVCPIEKKTTHMAAANPISIYMYIYPQAPSFATNKIPHGPPLLTHLQPCSSNGTEHYSCLVPGADPVLASGSRDRCCAGNILVESSSRQPQDTGAANPSAFRVKKCRDTSSQAFNVYYNPRFRDWFGVARQTKKPGRIFEPVLSFILRASSLQKKSQTPIKTGGPIWVPGNTHGRLVFKAFPTYGDHQLPTKTTLEPGSLFHSVLVD